MQLYVFFRTEGWYPMEYPDDEAAKAGAELNKGTLKVQNMLTKKVIWKAPTQDSLN